MDLMSEVVKRNHLIFQRKAEEIKTLQDQVAGLSLENDRLKRVKTVKSKVDKDLLLIPKQLQKYKDYEPFKEAALSKPSREPFGIAISPYFKYFICILAP